MIFSDEADSLNSEPDDWNDSIRNPFSTRFVQPGAIPYFFEPKFIEKIKRNDPDFYIQAFAESMNEKAELSTWIGCRYLANRFASERFCGQIVGPHGSGKSTLIAAMIPAFRRMADLSVLSFVLHDKTRVLPNEFYDELRLFEEKNAGKKILILDGFEQLNLVNRFRLRSLCRRKNLGLLMTTHRRQWGFPVLFRTLPSTETLHKIVDYLLDDSKIHPDQGALNILFGMVDPGNFRDILFCLYDWFEEESGNPQNHNSRKR